MSDSTAVSLESLGLQCSSKRCLRIDEVFQCILEYALEDTKGRRTVGRLAVTCKSFQEPALACLWRKLNSLKPLLHLALTTAQAAMPAIQHSSQSWLSMANADETVIAKYSQLVREFNWNRNEDVTADEIHKLFTVLPGDNDSSLFPNMRTIIWIEDRPSMFSYLLSILGPSTQSLSVHGSPNDHMLVARVLREARLSCKALEELTLFHFAQHPSVSNALSQLLSTCSANLRKLNSMVLLMPEGLHILSAMPRLTEAAFWLNSAPLNSTLLGPNAQLPFLSLTCLRFDIDSLDDHSLSFVRSIQAPNIQQLSISVTYQPDSSVLREHLDLLARAPGRDFLRLFSLDIEQVGPDSDEGNDTFDRRSFAVTSRVLGPLLHLGGLETFSLSAPWIELDLACLQACARTYKNIQTFQVHPRNAPRDTPYVPIEALVDFAEHCPELTTLGLCVDARRLPPDPVKFRSESFLKILEVYDAAIAAPESVAAFLDTLFPELEDVVYDFSSAKQWVPGDRQQWFAYLQDWECVRRFVAE